MFELKECENLMINKELIEHKGKRRLCVAPMVAKHNKTRGEQLVLQAIAGHMRKLLAALPETESLVQTGKVYRRLEDLIFKTYLPEQ